MPRIIPPAAPGSVPSAVADEVTATEFGEGAFRTTVLTLAAMPITVVGATGVGFGSTKLYDFPEGRILILGTVATLAFPITSTEGDLADTADGDFLMGSTGEEDGTMDRATDLDILPKTSTAANALSTAVESALAASAQIDGRTTAVDAYLSLCIDDAETDETSICGATGTIEITWINLGD